MSIFLNQRFALLLKSFFFLVALRYFFLDPGMMRAVVFVAFSALLYFRPLFNGAVFARSFIVLVSLALLSPRVFSVEYPWVLMFLYVTFFAILDGLKNFILIERRFWHQLLFFFCVVGLVASVAFLGFTVNAWLASAAFTIGIFLLISEFLSVQTKNAPFAICAQACAYTLLAIELLWALRLLPLSTLNIVSIFSIFALFSANSMIHFYRGTFNARMLLRRAAFLAAVCLSIVFTTWWSF